MSVKDSYIDSMGVVFCANDQGEKGVDISRFLYSQKNIFFLHYFIEFSQALFEALFQIVLSLP
jgi:hypothetical protein